MRPFRTRPGVPALAVVLASLSLTFGCVPSAQDETTPSLEGQRLAGAAPRGETTGEGSGGKTLSASIPARDARGEPVPGLPRPPGSVRAGYSEREANGLVLVRTSYLTREGADAVREFCRGVFGAEGWQVANVEYSGDGWHYLILRGDLEAEVEVLSRDGGSEANVELSGPVGRAQGTWASAGGSKR